MIRFIRALFGCLMPQDGQRSRVYSQDEGFSSLPQQGSHSDRVPSTPPSRIVPLKPFEDNRQVRPFPVEILQPLAGSLPRDLAHRAFSRLRADTSLSMYAPRLFEDHERGVYNGLVQFFAVGREKRRGKTSISLGVPDTRKLEIKYGHNCFDLSLLSPLVREYWMLKDLEKYEFAPKAYFLSPPVKFPLQVSIKTNFKLSTEARLRCSNEPYGHVRYLLKEARGSPLEREMFDISGNARFDVGILVTAQLIRAIEAIHSKGIIHGNIHAGNIYFRGKGGELGISGFDAAWFVSETKAMPELIRGRFERSDCVSSLYELQGYRPSYRDDVFMAVLLGATIMGGKEFADFCVSLEAHPEHMLIWKEQDFMFNYYGGPDRVESLVGSSFEAKKEIGIRLENILHSIRSMTCINQLPDYEAILTDLDAIIAMRQA